MWGCGNITFGFGNITLLIFKNYKYTHAYMLKDSYIGLFDISFVELVYSNEDPFRPDIWVCLLQKPIPNLTSLQVHFSIDSKIQRSNTSYALQGIRDNSSHYLIRRQLSSVKHKSTEDKGGQVAEVVFGETYRPL